MLRVVGRRDHLRILLVEVRRRRDDEWLAGALSSKLHLARLVGVGGDRCRWKATGAGGRWEVTDLVQVDGDGRCAGGRWEVTDLVQVKVTNHDSRAEVPTA